MSAPVAATTSISPTGRHLWSRFRGLLLALVVLIVGGVVIAALRSGEHHGSLDPRSADRYGSRAIATLLSEHGVTTRVVTNTAEATEAVGPDTTLLVSSPALLTHHQLSELRSATADTPARTVLLAPGQKALDTLAPGTRAAAATDTALQEPSCDLPAARRAGDAEVGGRRYITRSRDAERCYISDGLPTVLRLPGSTGGDTVLLGAPDILYNHRLAERGNASLALQLLGSHRHLVWYLPSISDPAIARDGDRPLSDLVPTGWRWGLLQLAVAAVLLALWRARRLGPLVPEHLPVAVPAAETTEGRARLYQQANARDQAAAVLRSATRARLAPLVGVPPLQTHSPDVLLPALTSHLASNAAPPPDLQPLLFGLAPGDDKALVQLADELDELERSILLQERHGSREHPDH